MCLQLSLQHLSSTFDSVNSCSHSLTLLIFYLTFNLNPTSSQSGCMSGSWCNFTLFVWLCLDWVLFHYDHVAAARITDERKGWSPSWYVSAFIDCSYLNFVEEIILHWVYRLFLGFGSKVFNKILYTPFVTLEILEISKQISPMASVRQR